MMEQLDMSAALFPRVERDPRRDCIEWLMRMRKCTSDVVPLVDRLYSEFPRWEAFDRAKVLPGLCGDSHIGGLGLDDAGRLGMFDHGVDYHLLWDRCWAVRSGLTPDEALRIERWDYSEGRPVLHGADNRPAGARRTPLP